MAKKPLISFNIQNEMVVLSNMIKSTKIRRGLSKDIKEYHWIGKRHRTIFNILCKMADKNLEFDFDTFESLAKENDDYGSISYLKKVQELFDENVNINHHVNILKKDALKHHIKSRRLEKLIDAVDDPHSEIEDIQKVLEQIKSDVKETVSSGDLLSGIDLRKDWWKDYQERKKNLIFVPTGLAGLDKWLNEGLARKKCSVWSARPGMGKTTTIANVILNQIRGVKNKDGEIISEPKKILLVPLETGHLSYIDIMVSILIKQRLEKDYEEDNSAIPKSMIGLPLSKLIKNPDEIDKNEDELVKWAMGKIFQNDNLVVTEDSYMSLNKLTAILENNNFDMVFIDLWEKLTDVKIDAGSIAEKLNQTQAISKDCNIHFGIVHQIRRPPESKGKVPPKPKLESLKNSGGFEEVADLVVLMHRPKYYDPELEEDVIEYIIAKQRRGEMNKSAFHDFYSNYGMVGSYRRNYTENTNEDVF